MSFPTLKNARKINPHPKTLEERFLEAYALGDVQMIRCVLNSGMPEPTAKASTADIELLGYATDAIQHEVWDSLRRKFSPINAWNGACIVAASYGVKFLHSLRPPHTGGLLLWSWYTYCI